MVVGHGGGEPFLTRFLGVTVSVWIGVCHPRLDGTQLSEASVHPPTLSHTSQVGVVKRDADERGAAFNGRPFLRVLSGLVSELTGSEAGDLAVAR